MFILLLFAFFFFLQFSKVSWCDFDKHIVLDLFVIFLSVRYSSHGSMGRILLEFVAFWRSIFLIKDSDFSRFPLLLFLYSISTAAEARCTQLEQDYGRVRQRRCAEEAPGAAVALSRPEQRARPRSAQGACEQPAGWQLGTAQQGASGPRAAAVLRAACKLAA